MLIMSQHYWNQIRLTSFLQQMTTETSKDCFLFKKTLKRSLYPNNKTAFSFILLALCSNRAGTCHCFHCFALCVWVHYDSSHICPAETCHSKSCHGSCFNCVVSKSLFTTEAVSMAASRSARWIHKTIQQFDMKMKDYFKDRYSRVLSTSIIM